MKEFNNIINGEKVQSGSNFGVINPATGEVFANCQRADAAMVDQAVVAARNAFSTWSKTSQQERKAKIHAIADALALAWVVIWFLVPDLCCHPSTLSHLSGPPLIADLPQTQFPWGHRLSLD
mgnify:CR=1 FL=1